MPQASRSKGSESRWIQKPKTECHMPDQRSQQRPVPQSAPFEQERKHKILYLFCDGIYLRLRPELRAHPAPTTVQAA